jgi:restriction system protein
MAIPDFQSIMLPLLKLAADQQEHASHEAVDKLSQFFQLSDQEKKEFLPSGKQQIFTNRVYWALTYLKRAKFLESTRRGSFRLTESGLRILQQNPPTINIKFLSQFPEFHQSTETPKKTKDKIEVAEVETEIISKQTPEELLEDGYQRIRQELAQELLSRVKSCSPHFFERLVVELLVKMGYGGSIKDAGQVIGKSGDEGIDGTIKEDRLGLDVIYIQAKKWEGAVGRPEIQKFVGALYGQRAKKGVFIATSSFSHEATEYVKNIDSKIVLIDGKQLADLMIDHGVGVSIISTYDVKKVDNDYFTEEI